MEAAIAVAKDRSKGELRLWQRWEDACRLEGARATTADVTGGDDNHARRRRQVQLEGGGAAIEGGGGGGGAHRRRSQCRRTAGTGSAGWTPAGCRSLSQREDEDDAATVMLQCSTSIFATMLVPAVK